jgi:sigma-54-specific transcriptional regulator
MRTLAEVTGAAATIAEAFPSVPLVVQGESGSGKSDVARAYARGAGRGGALVQLNCGALGTSDLLESRLFGHLRGAFTGAIADKTGALAEAEGGVLWLDEAHRLPRPVQAMLLTWLDTRKFRPLGAQEDRESDCRLILSTNRVVDELLGDEWLHDWWHRVVSYVLVIPPLRERPDDMGDVIDEAARDLGLPITEAVRRRLISAPDVWEVAPDRGPGNARRLRNVLRSAAIRATLQGDPVVDVRHLGAEHRRARGVAGAVSRIVASNPAITAEELGAELGVSKATAFRRLRSAGYVHKDGVWRPS